jgi:hypothetical protein
MPDESDMPPSDLVVLIHQYLADPESTWSIASFGAIAEFHADAGFIKSEAQDRGGEVITQSGGLRITLTSDAQFIPYEILSKRQAYWMQGGNFCLPKARATRHRRTTLTELGPDSDAMRDQDKDGILFDLGLGLECVTAMVRISDPDLIRQLREFDGQALLTPSGRGHHAFALLIQESPNRVFESQLGRIEVYSPIPAPEGQTGAGCHTHILPDLLAAGQTHSANVPVPDDLRPCFQLFPPNPILTKGGDARPHLDRDRFEMFQKLLHRYGMPDLIAAKKLARLGINTKTSPPDGNSFSRSQRTAIRIALRQMAFEDPNNPHIMQWISVFEPRTPENQ